MNENLSRFARPCAVLLACLPGVVLAQSAPREAAARADQPLRYESAFEGYRPYRDETPRNWREVNAVIGGAASAVPGAAPAPAAAASSAAPGHPDHRHPTPGGRP